MWDIPEKKINNKGYLYVRIPKHPKATSTGYVYEHRAVMENYIGRVLLRDEVVHHINGDRSDNRIENLMLTKQKEHALMHGAENHAKSFVVKLKCPVCGCVFFRKRGGTHLVPSRSGKLNVTCCSRRCRGVLSELNQTGRIDEKTKKAMESNVVCESFPVLDIEH